MKSVSIKHFLNSDPTIANSKFAAEHIKGVLKEANFPQRILIDLDDIMKGEAGKFTVAAFNKVLTDILAYAAHEGIYVN